jgi:hypothetical protein
MADHLISYHGRLPLPPDDFLPEVINAPLKSPLFGEVEPLINQSQLRRRYPLAVEPTA